MRPIINYISIELEPLFILNTNYPLSTFQIGFVLGGFHGYQEITERHHITVRGPIVIVMGMASSVERGWVCEAAARAWVGMAPVSILVEECS